MLKIHYVNGSIDSTMGLDPAELTGDVAADKVLPYVTKFKGGTLVALHTDGFVRLATDDDSRTGGIGILVNDAAGYAYENAPALASGVVPAIIGGCVVDTDQVVETDVAKGDPLYVGEGGKLTTVKPQEITLTEGAPNTILTYASEVVGVARSANSADDLTITVQLF